MRNCVNSGQINSLGIIFKILMSRYSCIITCQHLENDQRSAGQVGHVCLKRQIYKAVLGSWSKSDRSRQSFAVIALHFLPGFLIYQSTGQSILLSGNQ